MLGFLRRALCAVALVGCAMSALAAPTLPAQRPKIGLVLSGGGARGGAHIGVLKVLEELHVPVDVIVGTSAGSIVGAAYASGLTLEELEQEMARLNNAVLFRDVARDDVPYRGKSDDARNYVGPEFGIGANSLQLPKAAVAGVSLETVLRRLTRRQSTHDFDALPIPFRAIASDLATGDMVVLDHGDLAQAVRASMAIPGAVNPVELDGRLLVDGGLTRNLPVDIARKLGADVVIAVNIGTPLLKRENITSLLSVSTQMLTILTEANVRTSLQQLGPRDVLIAPDLGDVSSTDFGRLREAAQAGERAARTQADALRGLALPEDDYLALNAERFRDDRNRNLPIAEIHVTGTERVNPEVVLAAMKTHPGDTFDRTKLEADVKRIYGRGDFEAVNYALSEVPDKGGVVDIEVTEKSWGPNYLRFGLNLSSDFDGNAYFDLLATHRWTWLNSLGAEWRNDLQIGRTDFFSTEWYQPLTERQRVFVAPRAYFERAPIDVYDDNGQRLARLRKNARGVGFDVGAPIGAVGEARLGLVRGRVDVTQDTGTLPLSNTLLPNVSTGGALASVRVDALDNLRFPRTGYAASTTVYASRAGLGAADPYTRWSASGTGAFATGPHSFQFGVRAGGTLTGQRLPAYDEFTLGGFLNLSGYRTGQLVGNAVEFGRLLYNYRLAGPSVFDGAYIGFSAEAGRIGDTLSGLNRTSSRKSVSLYFAVDTPLGPVYLAYGRANTQNQAVYFFLGRP